MMFDRNKEPRHATKGSPQYNIKEKGLYATLTLGGGMMFLTIAGMLLIADTVLADVMATLYTFPIVGILVFGALITVGRHLGMKGVKHDNMVKAVTGAAILILSYSWFGGGILTPYESSTYTPAILVTGGITILITLIASAYVYSTDKNLEHWNRYSMYFFIGAVVSSLIGTLFTPVTLFAFVLALLGFTADLVYQIWVTSHKKRSAYANGIALYVAFAGVFVHILQIVLEVMAE